jgi:hypothetical protein
MIQSLPPVTITGIENTPPSKVHVDATIETKTEEKASAGEKNSKKIAKDTKPPVMKAGAILNFFKKAN